MSCPLPRNVPRTMMETLRQPAEAAVVPEGWCRMKKGSRITLEPALEEISALWTEEKSLQMACVYERWARQLRVKVRIIEADRPKRRPSRMRRLPERRLRLN